jgi:biopolymer transport protein ExbD
MSFNPFEKEDFHAPNAEINTTPLVDVMLVLMVIFLVTAPVLEQSIALNLPKTASVSISQSTPVTVSITQSGNYFWEGQEISKEELTQKLLEVKGSKEQILIRADSQTQYSTVAFVLAEASRVGVTNIGFAVDGKN